MEVHIVEAATWTSIMIIILENRGDSSLLDTRKRPWVLGDVLPSVCATRHGCTSLNKERSFLAF